MKARETFHSNGDISIRLIPENDKERQTLNTILSRPPGGCKISAMGAYLEAPVTCRDQLLWDGSWSVGNCSEKDGIFSRRLAFGGTHDES